MHASPTAVEPGSLEGLSEQRFEALYRATWPVLVDYFRFRIGGEEAVDAASDVFVRAWRARMQFDPARGAAEAWLWAIARNVAKDRYRRLETWAEPIASDLAMEASLVDDGARAEALAKVNAALAQLAAIDREIVALRFGGGLSHREIGAALGIGDAVAATRLHRAIKRLRQLVEGGRRS